MILRAAFFIVLVSLMMPREPDLGFGHPGANAKVDGFSGMLHSVVLRNAQQVKADIREAQLARAHRELASRD
ncbi:MAG TPA: hypothetical protein VK779_05670 [Rhizomicrobium sp.]|jgi:hypothetical protein|nr:hypothetical protein [Rhizomicrobium sp.]